MDETDERYAKERRKALILAAILLVAVPAICLIVSQVVTIEPQAGGHQDMMFYILIIMAAIQPALAFPIAGFQIAAFKRSTMSEMSAAQLYTSISVVRAAFVEAIYLYGLVIYLMSGDLTRMLAFYPMGIIWSWIHWPRQASLEKFREKVEGL